MAVVEAPEAAAERAEASEVATAAAAERWAVAAPAPEGRCRKSLGIGVRRRCGRRRALGGVR